ncbi:MAG: hypothetical protein JWQ98_413 [Chlorobi bacterium]|nr:hypothetical protein [Chlorobiota bacterium]
MRKLLLVLSFALLISASLSAQTFVSPSSGATFIGSFPLHIWVESDPNGGIRESKKPAVGDTYTLVGSFRTSGGRTEYVICTDSIRFAGADSLINASPTAALYEIIAHAAAERGNVLGFSPCLPSDQCGDNTLATKVYAEACVQRIGVGSMTRFIPCDRYVLSNRGFMVCCSGVEGAPNVIRILSNGGLSCPGSGCDATCPPSGGGGGQIN